MGGIKNFRRVQHFLEKNSRPGGGNFPSETKLTTGGGEIFHFEQNSRPVGGPFSMSNKTTGGTVWILHPLGRCRLKIFGGVQLS